MKFIVRNDDVAFETSLDEIKKFCEICDKHGYKIIQSITPIGAGGRRARAHISSEEIRLMSFKRFEENKGLVEFLRARNDYIGVHGLWHTHEPPEPEILKGKNLLSELGFNPTYFVPPFNEGDYPEKFAGLTLTQLSMDKGESLETFLNGGTPLAPIMYLHSWRFTKYYTFDQLDQCLARLSKLEANPQATPHRLWYNDWVAKNAKGKVLDVGKSLYWDYGFPTIDIKRKLKPTYVANIEKTDFPDEKFDTVLCIGMYEHVNNPQAMIDEVLRITKKGGTVIFGFVGKDYKPYRKIWKFYEGKETLPPHSKQDFGKEYHFIICQK